MNNALRKISFVVGLGLLGVSMYWSQDGWNFNVAGDSGYGDLAIAIGWFLALTVTVVQFVFSSNFRELNPSLILFGALAYAYSIYTNYQGILHFQGGAQSKVSAMILGIVMDGVPEPLIAWALGESLSGDFVGNLIKSFMSPFNNNQGNRQNMPKNISFQQEGGDTQPRMRFPAGFMDKLPKEPPSDDELKKKIRGLGYSLSKSGSENKIHGVKSHQAGRHERNRRN